MNNSTINQQSSKPEQQSVLEVKNLSKTFEMGRGFKRSQVHALRNVSFNLHSGRALALVGESGSGKSNRCQVDYENV